MKYPLSNLRSLVTDTTPTLGRQRREWHNTSQTTHAYVSPQPISHTLSHTSTMTIGIPVKLLHEAEGHIVSLELLSGSTYRGKMIGVEDNMNVQLKDIVVTARDGAISRLDQAYIRGSQIRFFVIPDMLENAPMLQQTKSTGPGKPKTDAKKSTTKTTTRPDNSKRQKA